MSGVRVVESIPVHVRDAVDPPNAPHDVLVWFKGCTRPGIAAFNRGSWHVLTRPEGAAGMPVVAWADYPARDTEARP